MYWLRWHYHVKDVAGAPYKIKKKSKQKDNRRHSVVVVVSSRDSAAADWMPSKPKPHRHRRTLSRRARQNLRSAKLVDLSVVCVGMRNRWSFTNCSRSAVYSRNRIGPRTDPCGIPYRTADGVELAADVRTCWTRPHKYEANQFGTCSPRP